MNRLYRVAIALASLICGGASQAQEAPGSWTLVQGAAESRSGSICFYYIVTSRTNSPFTSQGRVGARFDPKGSRVPCEAGNSYAVDLATRRVFLGTPFGNDATRLVRLKQRFAETGAIALLEKERQESQATAAKSEREEYLSRFEAAKTLPAIQDFEKRYAGNDPDGLIPKLSALKPQLELDEYRSKFAGATTSAQLAAFISTYEGNDPENLVPEAKKRLPVLQSQEEQARLSAQRTAQERENAKNLAKLEGSITWCKSQSSAARQTIEREHRIGTVSGYENKLALRQAGEMIVMCQDRVEQDYAEYKRQGGKKALADIQ